MKNSDRYPPVNAAIPSLVGSPGLLIRMKICFQGLKSSPDLLLRPRDGALQRSLRGRKSFAFSRSTAYGFSLPLHKLHLTIFKIDYLTVAYATHRLSGIVTPANAAYTAEELTHQLVSSGSKVLFTCASLFKTAQEAAQGAGLAHESVYLIQIPDEEKLLHQHMITIDQLMKQSEHAPPLEPLTFVPGQGARQTAFLCYSSGTSGQPVSSITSTKQ